MKDDIIVLTNYQQETLVLFKQKLPSLILGVIITFCMVLLLTSKLRVFKRKQVQVKNTRSLKVESVKTYTVKFNDDLWGIAEKMYGSGLNALDIAAANHLSEPYTLTENQILIIPSVASKKPTQGDITEQAAQTQRATEYIVLPGEYLWQIAEKVYGDGNQMSKLIDANRIPYPYNVEEGQKLLVP